jgi:putative membrane protein insertion efficiency factor
MAISPGLPANTCRFYPSCSHYGYQSVYKYGALKGSLMAAWRVLRCNPFGRGGVEHVPGAKYEGVTHHEENMHRNEAA